MGIYNEFLDEGEFTPEEIRNAIIEENDNILGEFADEGEFSSDEVLKALSQETGMPDIIGGFDDTMSNNELKILTDNNSFLTTDVMEDTLIEQPSTIQSEDVASTMPLEDMYKSNKQGIINDNMTKSFIGGAKRLPIGISTLIQDGLNKSIEMLGDNPSKEDYYEFAKDWMIDNEEAIKKANERAGLTGDEMFTPDNIGQIASEIATLPLAGLKVIKGAGWATKWMKTKAVALEAGLAGTSELGKSGDYAEAGTSAAIAGVATGAGGLAIEGIQRVGIPFFKKVAKMGNNIGTNDLQMLKDATGIKEADLQKLISETDPDILPLVLAEAGGDKTRPLLAQAIKEGDNNIIAKYMDRMTNRSKAAYKSAGGDTYEATSKVANESYDDMVKNIEAMDLKIDYDGTGFQKELNKLKNISFDDATDKKLQGFLNQLDDEPIETLSELMKARREINKFARDAKNSDQAYRLRAMSRDMGDYIGNPNNVDEATSEYIKSVNTMYGRSIKQGDTLDIFAKFSGESGTGYSKTRATDWTGLKKALTNEGIDSPEANAMMNIAKQFEKKIGNLDDILFGGVKTEAGKDQASGIATTIQGRIDQMVTKNMFNIIMDNVPGLESKQLKNMQKLIGNALAKSNNADELAKNIVENSNTPKSMRESINNLLSNIKSDFKAKQKSGVKQTDTVIEPDETIDAKPLVKSGDIVDVEVQKQITSNGNPKQIGTNNKGNQIPQSKDLTSKNNIDEGYKERAKTIRLQNLEEINKFKGKKHRTSSENKKLHQAMADKKKYDEVRSSMPKEFKDMDMIEEALENGLFPVGKRKGPKIQDTKSGRVLVDSNNEEYIYGSSIDSNAIQMELKPVMVNRIKKGEGTKEDFAALRHDAMNLIDDEAQSVF